MSNGVARLSLRERQRLEREELILQATQDILLEKGYHDMLMDEVAARVGIAKSTVYFHFPSKDDLVVALVERKLKLFASLLAEIVDQELPAREKLEILFQRIYMQRAAMCENGSAPPFFLLTTLYNSMDLLPILNKVEQHTHDLRLCIHNHLMTILKQGQQSGEFDRSLPPEVMLGGFFSMLMPRIFAHMISERQLSFEELARYTKYMYFKSIAGPSAIA